VNVCASCAARGLSQEERAHAVGVHRTYMGIVERGEQNISLTNVHELANALDVPMSGIFPDLKLGQSIIHVTAWLPDVSDLHATTLR